MCDLLIALRGDNSVRNLFGSEFMRLENRRHLVINEEGWYSDSVLVRFGPLPILRAPLGLACIRQWHGFH